MKISVIIPVYNEEKVIEECLKSLSKQTVHDFEVIIVDDGSTDRTLNIIKNLVIKNFNLIIVEQDHKGAGAARNLGANRAKGEILVFVDADMTFDKDFLKNLVKPILIGNAIGTFSKEEYLKNKDNVWARFWNLNRGLPADRMHPPDYPVQQKVFRAVLKSEFTHAGGFDPRGGYTDDSSLSERLGKEAVASTNAVFYHKNPDTLKEVFIHSKWMSKRKYKLGIFGSFFTLLLKSLPFSILLGVSYSIKHRSPLFFVFRIISDFGQFIGIIEYIGGVVAK